MARKPRLFVSGATYHVYCRVARGEFVFDDPHEAEEFVEAVRQVRDLDNWRVLAWCLMGNHYHLVIKTGSIVPPRPTPSCGIVKISSGLKDGNRKPGRSM